MPKKPPVGALPAGGAPNAGGAPARNADPNAGVGVGPRPATGAAGGRSPEAPNAGDGAAAVAPAGCDAKNPPPAPKPWLGAKEAEEAGAKGDAAPPAAAEAPNRGPGEAAPKGFMPVPSPPKGPLDAELAAPKSPLGAELGVPNTPLPVGWPVAAPNPGADGKLPLPKMLTPGAELAALPAAGAAAGARPNIGAGLEPAATDPNKGVAAVAGLLAAVAPKPTLGEPPTAPKRPPPEAPDPGAAPKPVPPWGAAPKPPEPNSGVLPAGAAPNGWAAPDVAAAPKADAEPAPNMMAGCSSTQLCIRSEGAMQQAFTSGTLNRQRDLIQCETC